MIVVFRSGCLFFFLLNRSFLCSKSVEIYRRALNAIRSLAARLVASLALSVLPSEDDHTVIKGDNMLAESNTPSSQEYEYRHVCVSLQLQRKEKRLV